MESKMVEIDGMTCGHCVEQVSKAFDALSGVHVHSVQVGQALVSFNDSKMAPDVIIEAIKALGYGARWEEPSASDTQEGVRSDAPSDHQEHATGPHQASLTSRAVSATAHCLTGCAIGEALGMVIGNYFEIGNMSAVAISIVLAFLFGYLLTLIPLVKNGMAFRTALGLAFASDTWSIATMEVIDNAVMLLIPGAMHAGLGTALF